MITDSAVLKMIERYLNFLESANNLYNDTDKKAEIQFEQEITGFCNKLSGANSDYRV